jgi:arylsulfatase A-like enzyme
MANRRDFLKVGAGAAAAALAQPLETALGMPATHKGPGSKPNIVLILADDMGFSDIGCFGSEVSTPNLDRLASRGIRISQFYNNPRCCPSRASIMTGLYSQQAGMGMMVADHGRYPYPGYAGELSKQTLTIPEALKTAGYNTAMVGKWHLGTEDSEGKHDWPLQRGFDHFWGMIAGASVYYESPHLFSGNDPLPPPPADQYLTDLWAEHAAGYVTELAAQKQPFFLYTAFNAPHWPIQAPEDLIGKYSKRYADGWDALRKERHKKQLAMGIVSDKWELTPRDPRVPAWENVDSKDWEMRRMAVYAAMIERMDRGVGRVLSKLDELGLTDNTLVMFMSDNGGNFEELNDPGDAVPRDPWIPYKTHDGRPVNRGNKPSVMPGGEDTYQSIGIPWGNCANTPFRLYKHYAHEGGISTPFIAHWPKGIKQRGSVTHQLGHETDIMATCLDLANVPYPAKARDGEQPPALAGTSLRPIFEGRQRTDRGPMFWEHEGNAAMRDGKWKLVSRFPDAWELHDMEADRTEIHNVAELHPERVLTMASTYNDWAKRVGVQTWPMPETPRGEQDGAMTAPAYLRHDRP